MPTRQAEVAVFSLFLLPLACGESKQRRGSFNTLGEGGGVVISFHFCVRTLAGGGRTARGQRGVGEDT